MKDEGMKVFSTALSSSAVTTVTLNSESMVVELVAGCTHCTARVYVRSVCVSVCMCVCVSARLYA